MKLKLLALGAAVGMTVSAYGQGVLNWNISNQGVGGPNAIIGGLLYTNNAAGTALGLFDGINLNVGIESSGGPNSGSLQPLGTHGGLFTVAFDSKGYTGFDLGKFQAGGSVLVPGVSPGGIATIQLKIWLENSAGSLFQNYAGAVAGGGSVATATFQNPTGSTAPPIPDQQMTGMPSMILAPVPEPSTIAMGALGLASLLIFRRRQ